MEQQPSSGSNSGGKREVVPPYKGDHPSRRRGEYFRDIFAENRVRGQRTRVGRFLYLTFAEMGVRASAEVATRNERSSLMRQFMIQRIIANWRATRRILEGDARE